MNNDMYKRLMALTDEEFERLENAEAELTRRLGVTKLHEFDNVGIKDGELYALEALNVGDEIVKCGEAIAKATRKITVGEKI